MTPVFVAVRLWSKTVAMNAVLYGMSGLFVGELWRVPASVLFLIAGFILTLPLLMLITPLVRLSTWLPYSIPAKIGWLSFSLLLVIIIFYSATSLIIEQNLFSRHSPINTMMGCTITGLVVAVFTTRKSLITLHTEKAEEISMRNSL
jgi:uncharacterized membrane protein